MIETRYRAVWPNGEMAIPPHTDKEEFFQEYDNANVDYKNMGIPSDFWPKVEVQEVEINELGWLGYQDYCERQFERENLKKTPPVTSGVEYVNQVEIPTGKHALEVPQPWQIEQVRKKAFGWSDPCIMCGQKFQTCPHNHSETAVYVEYIKKGPWFK